MRRRIDAVLGRMLRAASRHRWFAALGSRVATPLDRWVHRLTGKRFLLTPRSLDPVMLLLPGRQPVPLLTATVEGTLVIAGTNWGRPHHPAWSSRLLDAPEAVVLVHGDSMAVRARLLHGNERARAWDALLAVWPGYNVYEERSGRVARVFALQAVM